MISGQVQAHHALLNAAVRLPGQPDVTLESPWIPDLSPP